MIKVIFSIPFTGKTPYSDNQTQTWYDFRAGIFEKYTLKSLENQTDKDFLIWLQFRPEEINNPTTKKIDKALKKSKLDYIMTFNGPIMKEDRATWHNQDLIERAEKSLKELEPKVKEFNYIYETNLDSDDMVYKDFVKVLKQEPFRERGALYQKDGFIYEISGRLAFWHNPISQQNYTIMYPVDIFLDAKKHFEYQNGLDSHEQIPEKFNAKEMPKGFYCAIIHGTNISTVWGHPFMGQEIFYEEEKESILKDFGIEI